MGCLIDNIFRQRKRRRKRMRNKLILGTTLTLSLVLTVSILTVFPTLANSTPRNSLTEYATVAEVVLQLPPPGGALISRPSNLRISVFDYDKRSDSADALQVLIWVSALNTYVPIAFIKDQAWSAQEKAVLNNTAMYLEVNGVVIRDNLKVVADQELDVWMEKSSEHSGNGHWGWDNYGRYIWQMSGDNTLLANLTIPVQLDYTGLSSVFGSSFAVPKMSMRFVEIAEGHPTETAAVFPSGTTISSKTTAFPAWVGVVIPSWGTGTQFFAGGVGEDTFITFTMPQ
jgi:hypothetical protein